MDGGINARLNDSSVHTSFGDNWLSYGGGFTIQFLKRHNLYVDFERMDGGQFDSPWNVNGGYRVTF